MPLRQLAVLRGAHAHLRHAGAVQGHGEVADEHLVGAHGFGVVHAAGLAPVLAVLAHLHDQLARQHDPGPRVLQEAHRHSAHGQGAVQGQLRGHVHPVEAHPAAGAPVLRAAPLVDERIGAAGGVLRVGLGQQGQAPVVGDLVVTGGDDGALAAVHHRLEPQLRGVAERERSGVEALGLLVRRRAPVDLRRRIHVAQRHLHAAAESLRRRRGPRRGHDGRHLVLRARPEARRAAPGALARPQLEDQLAAGQHLVVAQPAPPQLLAVVRHPLHRALARAPRGEHGAALQGDAHALVQRRHHQPLQGGGRHVVQAVRRQHVPAAHLPAVLVADQAVGPVGVELAQDGVHAPVREVRAAGEVVEPCHVVAGLVAVGVLAHAAGDVGLLAAGGGAVHGEQGVQHGHGGRVAAQQLHVAAEVVRRGEAVLPAVGLGVMEVHAARVVGRQPAAVDAGAEAARGGVEEVAPALGAAAVGHGHVVAAQGGGVAADAGVVVGVLQGLADRFVLLVGRDVAQALVGVQAEVVALRAVQHGLQHQVLVHAVDALEPGVGQHAHAVVADHAVGLVAGQLPHGQAAALLEARDHGGQEVARAPALHQGEQGVRGPVRVPEREHGVAVAPAHVGGEAVAAAVAPVHVAEQVGGHEAVVDGRGQHGALVVGDALHLEGGEHRVPGVAGGGAGGREIEVHPLGLQVAPRAGGVHAGQGHLGHHLAAGEAEGQHGLGRAVGLIAGRGPGVGHRERPRELGAEVHQLVLGPRARAAEALHGVVVHDGQAHVQQLVALGQVDDQRGGVARREHVAVHPRARRGGELHLDAGIGQHRAVPAGGGLLVGLAEGGAVAVRGVVRVAAHQHGVAQEGHEQHVAVVAHAGAAEVGVAEAVDHGVVEMVAGAAVPAREPRVGAELHHAEGDRGAGEGVAVGAGADERVHAVHHGGRGRGGPQEQAQQESGHSSSPLPAKWR